MNGLKKIMEGDCVIGKEWNQMIDTEMDIAFFRDVVIQFHIENIYRRKKVTMDEEEAK